jgi:hypothetical protein
VQGGDVHLILCNGARLRLTGGLKLEGDNTKLYLGTDNTLYYPSSTMTIGSFRAYFQLLGDLTAGEPEPGRQPIRVFNLNFGEEEMAIRLMEDGRGKMDDAWFTLDGRKLMQTPVAKGIYIRGDRCPNGRQARPEPSGFVVPFSK